MTDAAVVSCLPILIGDHAVRVMIFVLQSEQFHTNVWLFGGCNAPALPLPAESGHSSVITNPGTVIIPALLGKTFR